MREILFRGKRIDNEEWVEGDLYRKTDTFGEHETIIFQDKGPGYFRKNLVDAETICQYTGMEDEDGNSIFEGDILEIFGMVGKVVRECGAFGLYFPYGIDYDILKSKIPYNNRAYFCCNDNFISLWELWWNYEQDDNPLYCAKIIGNDFDNPNLL